MRYAFFLPPAAAIFAFDECGREPEPELVLCIWLVDFCFFVQIDCILCFYLKWKVSRRFCFLCVLFVVARWLVGWPLISALFAGAQTAEVGKQIVFSFLVFGQLFLFADSLSINQTIFKGGDAPHESWQFFVND